MEVQINAISAMKEGKEWQKELFVEDSGVLGIIFGGPIALTLIPLELPLLIGVGVLAGGSMALSTFLKNGAKNRKNNLCGLLFNYIN